MSRKSAGVEAELILISEAVARLKDGMYGGLQEPKPVASIKANIKKGLDVGEVCPSIGWQPRNEDATARIYEAILQDKLSVFVPPVGTEKKDPMPLHVPLDDVLTRMITMRGGLPDYTIEPRRIFAKTRIAPELLAALSTSPLYLRRKEFEAWYAKASKKRNWPSQRPHYLTPANLRSRSKKNPIGRPSKQSDLRGPIAALVSDGQWSAEQNFIACLCKLLKSQGLKASRQTVERAVEQLHRETGDPRYYYADPRKEPDESVWGSFEDLAERRRRQTQK